MGFDVEREEIAEEKGQFHSDGGSGFVSLKFQDRATGKVTVIDDGQDHGDTPPPKTRSFLRHELYYK